jgi:hypothetical protein
MFELKPISVERAALLAAEGEISSLYFLNTSNNDLHCAENSNIKLKNIKEKTWFQKVKA